MKVALRDLDQYLESSKLEPVRMPNCPFCAGTAHRIYKRIKHHGHQIPARIKKIGKDICRFTMKGNTTNWIY